ncbi:hypothetical protein C9986_00035 [Pseudidiomarina aestuarii]|uniref:Uncharacterized protein n=2 Tax=Pseudidiomarina aestuarii TaxID=624146 RepID=A0A2T4CP29_9GAMM|nr:hypothetical protein C9986_00035 [Pseudidiomarina aestuarii]
MDKNGRESKAMQSSHALICSILIAASSQLAHGNEMSVQIDLNDFVVKPVANKTYHSPAESKFKESVIARHHPDNTPYPCATQYLNWDFDTSDSILREAYSAGTVRDVAIFQRSHKIEWYTPINDIALNDDRKGASTSHYFFTYE